MTRPRPRLVDTVLADTERDGLDEERRQLADVPARYRANVLARMRRWEGEIDGLYRRIARLRGRLSADNAWLTAHPEEL